MILMMLKRLAILPSLAGAATAAATTTTTIRGWNMCWSLLQVLYFIQLHLSILFSIVLLVHCGGIFGNSYSMAFWHRCCSGWCFLDYCKKQKSTSSQRSFYWLAAFVSALVGILGNVIFALFYFQIIAWRFCPLELAWERPLSQHFVFLMETIVLTTIAWQWYPMRRCGYGSIVCRIPSCFPSFHPFCSWNKQLLGEMQRIDCNHVGNHHHYFHTLQEENGRRRTSLQE